ncbi:MAG: DMT family transporter [Intrasporangium sp.]|uniref:DMT family transporter n=1 Tax=Intrasporangium sp. TaxID=1925024 RepID=UPI002647447E|nr:DMT family transporter [Intrasporangium sp.]MDN5795534.1 DMT family transporter [Intrasporangium sp.]
MLVGLLCALGSAAAFAGCSVFQHLAARADPRHDAWLLLRLVRRPLWLAGGVLNAVGVGLQAVALAYVPILVVAPVRLAGLPMALPMTAAIDKRRIRLDEIGAALLCAGGGAGFLLATHTTGGRPALTGVQGIVLVVVAVAVDAVCALLARRRDWRFVALATSGGLLNGLNAALLATVSRSFAGSNLSVLVWAVPALAAVGLLALLRTQQGLQAAQIGPPLAAMTIAEPVAAVVAGVLLLGEAVPGDATARAVQVLSAAAGLAGAGLLRYLEGERRSAG